MTDLDKAILEMLNKKLAPEDDGEKVESTDVDAQLMKAAEKQNKIGQLVKQACLDASEETSEVAASQHITDGEVRKQAKLDNIVKYAVVNGIGHTMLNQVLTISNKIIAREGDNPNGQFIAETFVGLVIAGIADKDAEIEAIAQE
jgi:hypothetical protein